MTSTALRNADCVVATRREAREGSFTVTSVGGRSPSTLVIFSTVSAACRASTTDSFTLRSLRSISRIVSGARSIQVVAGSASAYTPTPVAPVNAATTIAAARGYGRRSLRSRRTSGARTTASRTERTRGRSSGRAIRNA